jgi:hypothetical protein
MTEHRASILIALLGTHACAQGVVPGHFDEAETLAAEAVESEEVTADVGASPPGPCLPVSPCFRASMLLPVSPDPRSPWVADVTGDGEHELVLANAAVGIVQVLAGPSWTGFEREIVLNVGAPIASVTTADLDGDGVDDVVVHPRGSAEISVFWGGDLLEGAWSLELPGVPSAIGAHARDGAPHELVLGFEDGTLRMLDLSDDPRMGPAMVLSAPSVQVVRAHPGVEAPLVVVGSDGTISVLSMPGMDAQHVLEVQALFAVLGDVTGDGRADATLHSNHGPPRVFLDVRTSFGDGHVLPGATDAVAVTLADLDGDGRVEILWADAHARLHVGGWQHGQLVERLSLDLEAVPTSLVTGDLDGDDWPDVVAVHTDLHMVEILARRR